MTEARVLVTAIATVSFLAACSLPRFQGPAPEVLARPTLPVTATEQEIAVLAFVSYAGELLEGTDDEVEAKLAPCLVEELSLQPLVGSEWQLVWGPGVYKFAGADLDDNMMYVVQRSSDPSQMVVGVRGTNSKAILDWLAEDLSVLRTEAWAWKQDAPDLKPRISEGTSEGLRILREMIPSAGIPGDGLDLQTFLAARVEKVGAISVTVAGHSLGGALAPALGLYLEDTRKVWDPDARATVSVWGFAGPTPGDADFAAYYDQRLSTTSHRIHNPYDVVPLSWQANQMETISGLYRPHANPPFGLRQLVSLAVDVTRHHHYRQQLQEAPAIAGSVFAGVPKFLEQVGCQHTCGYYRGLKLVVPDGDGGFDQRIKPITKDCSDFHPQPRCDLCPDWTATP